MKIIIMLILWYLYILCLTISIINYLQITRHRSQVIKIINLMTNSTYKQMSKMFQVVLNNRILKMEIKFKIANKILN